eukprot:1454736-Rhodomonas_salina.2
MPRTDSATVRNAAIGLRGPSSMSGTDVACAGTRRYSAVINDGKVEKIFIEGGSVMQVRTAPLPVLQVQAPGFNFTEFSVQGSVLGIRSSGCEGAGLRLSAYVGFVVRGFPVLCRF